MKNSISKRDWETLSAYLDSQLSHREQARFESRLSKDLQLQAALEDMRQTRLVLRSAPKLRAPRNFLLSPEIAGNPIRFPRLAPVFGWASAVTTFLLVLVLVGDFFTDGGLAPVDLIFSQQNEYLIQRSVISEREVFPQPAVSEELSVSSKSVVESAQGADSAEIQAEAAQMDVAAYELTMESAGLEDEPFVGLQESEPLMMENAAADEEPTPENPEENETAASDLPSEKPLESSDEGLDEPQEAAEVMVQSSDALTEVDATADSFDGETVQESPTAAVESEEIAKQEMGEVLEQPTGTAAETAMIADERTIQEVPLASDESDTITAIESLPVDAPAELEMIPGSQASPANERDLVMGVEVILAMGALGTGLAWIYTRRRAG